MIAGVPVTTVPIALQPDKGRVQIDVPAGMTIAEIVALALPGLSDVSLRRVRVVLSSQAGRQVVPREVWHVARPHAGVHLLIQVLPGKDALRSILSILVTVAATAIAGFFAPAVAGALGISEGFAKGILGFGLTALGGLLINALMPPPKPEKEERPEFAIAGWKNQFTPDAPVPVVFGRHRYAPPFASYSHIEVVGDVLYNRAIFLWGHGPLEISDLKLGDTPVGKFDEIEIETRQGYDDDLPLSLYIRQTLEEQIGTDLERLYPRDDAGDLIKDTTSEETPVSRFTAANVTEAISIFSLPGGLLKVNSKGKKLAWHVDLRRRYRRVGTEAWTSLPDLVITAKKQAGFYRADRIEFPERGRYEIEYTRLTDSEPGYGDDDQFIQTCTWVVLQSVRPEYPLNFAKPVALTALRVKATAQLNGTLDTLNGIVQRIAPDWDGGDWVERPTKNPASAALFALRGPGLYRPTPDAEIDFPAFQDWHSFCVAKGLAYNRIHDFEGTFGETLAAIGAAGRAAVRWDGRKWTVVIDRPRDRVIDHVNPRNSSGFTASASYFEPPHGLRVPFLDETNDYQQGERIVPWPGHIGAIDITEELKLPGKTHPDEIWREARRRQYEIMHRSVRYRAVQQGVARAATAGDLVMVSRDVLKRAIASARVKGVHGDLVEIDDVWAMEAGKSYAIRFRYFDADDTVGESVVRTVATVAGAAGAVRLTGTGRRPAEGDILHFGPTALDSLPLIVAGIERGKDNASVLHMLPAAEIIDDLTDAEAPPAWDGRVGSEVDLSLVAPVAPVFTEIATGVTGTEVENGLTVMLRAGTPDPVIVSGFKVWHRMHEAGAWSGPLTCSVGAGAVTIPGYVAADEVDVQARAVSVSGVDGAPGPIVTVTIGSKDAALPAALPAGAVTIEGGLGSALITIVTGADEATAQFQVYRNAGGALNRETDAIGHPIPSSPLSTIQKADGDTTRKNLILNGTFTGSAAGWTLAAGWIYGADKVTHSGGFSVISQDLSLASGKTYRTAMTVSGRTAGLTGMRLSGGTAVVGTYRSGNGRFLDKLTESAPTTNTSLVITGDASFNGSIDDVVIFEQTPACLPQGTHQYFIEPQNEDGRPGPVYGPIPVMVI